MNARRYYRHSGVCPPLGLLKGLAGGIVASLLIALVYTAIGHYNRFVYFEMLLAVLAGGLSALAGLSGLKRGRVRSRAAAHFTAAVCGLTTLYIAWILWVALLLHRPGIGMVPLVEVTKHPSVLWETILWINERGTWGLRHSTEPMTGGALWFFWGLEALCLGGMGLLVSWLTTDPYCEACQLWCVKEDYNGILAGGDEEETSRRVKAADIPYLAALGRAQADDTAWLNISLSSCPGCRHLHTLTVSAARQESWSVKRVRDLFKNPMLQSGLIIDDAEAESIRRAVRA